MLTSCTASLLGPSEDELNRERHQFELFLAKKFLTHRHYERYYFDDINLWKECGTLSLDKKTKRKRLYGDSFFQKDQSLELERRRVEKLNSKQRLELKRISSKVYRRFKDSQDELSPPGGIYALNDSGLLYLNYFDSKNRLFLTSSLDETEKRGSSSNSTLRKLLIQVQKIGPKICKY